MKRIVHVSIANPSLESPLGYYKGKAQLEQAVIDSDLSYAIVRPTVIFGVEDILINNIAWFLRRFPFCSASPVMAATPSALSTSKTWRDCLPTLSTSQGMPVLDAVGPETYSFEELVRLIAEKVGRSVRLVHSPTPLAYLSTLLTGWFVGDVVLSLGRVQGLDGKSARSARFPDRPNALE